MSKSLEATEFAGSYRNCLALAPCDHSNSTACLESPHFATPVSQYDGTAEFQKGQWRTEMGEYAPVRPSEISYEKTGITLDIYFKCSGLSLRDVGIFSTAIHKAFSSGVASAIDENPYESDESLVSLAVVTVSKGSIRLSVTLEIPEEIKVKLSKINTLGLVGAIVFSISLSFGSNGQVSERMNAEHMEEKQIPRVTEGITEMINAFEVSGKEGQVEISYPDGDRLVRFSGTFGDGRTND